MPTTQETLREWWQHKVAKGFKRNNKERAATAIAGMWRI
jgi:hypothetical protein